MEFKVRAEGHKELEVYTVEQLENLMEFSYCPRLTFQDPSILETIKKKCQKAVEKEKISTKQKWLGALYGKEIATGECCKLTIEWIDHIFGYGVFADQEIYPSMYIGEYAGVVKKHPWLFHKSNDYCFVYAIGECNESRFYIDAGSEGNITRFINHSDTPNVEPVSVFYEGVMHIVLRAIRKISRGEQLTYDYGPDYWKKRAKIGEDCKIR